jgi:hypothetical protein
VSGMVPPHVVTALAEKQAEREQHHVPAPLVSLRD